METIQKGNLNFPFPSRHEPLFLSEQTGPDLGTYVYTHRSRLFKSIRKGSLEIGTRKGVYIYTDFLPCPSSEYIFPEPSGLSLFVYPGRSPTLRLVPPLVLYFVKDFTHQTPTSEYRWELDGLPVKESLITVVDGEENDRPVHVDLFGGLFYPIPTP